jgi:hypothetical protein
MTEMAPGIEDKRTLFGLSQLITALRQPMASTTCSSPRICHVLTMPTAVAGPEIER